MISPILFVIAIAIVQSDKTINKTTVRSTKGVIKLKTNSTKVTNTNASVITTIEKKVEDLITKQFEEESLTPKKVNINKIANELVSLLKTEGPNRRINELKEKLKKIESYVIDRDKFNEYLREQTAETHLNSTSFFKSLQEDDHLKFLMQKDPKSLYLKLKEKMNRDDVLRIISERGNEKKIVRYARRMMGIDAVYDSKNKKDLLNAVVNKFLGATASDNHTFTHYKNESVYWDPQKELEDMHEQQKQQVNGRRLFAGSRTTVRYYPFMVSVHVVGRFWCGGVLYWHDLVLTSASCLQLTHNNRFFRENPRVLQVRVGSNHSRIGGEMTEALEVYFHPAYNPRTLRNNIALIRLRRRLFFSYHRVPRVIEISRYPHGISASVQVLLLGWGVTQMSQKMSYEPIYLQKKELPVYPSIFCKEVYGDKFISETMFCAGTMTTGEGACDHDAGGPAIHAGKLVGIISFGPTVCGFPNAPTVFTLVGAYADWIEKVNASMPHYYRGKKHTTTTTRHLMFSYLETLLHLHTSTPASPGLEEVPAAVEPEILRTAKEILDDPAAPEQRIPPPVFKLTKNKKDKKKGRKRQKKDKQQIEIEFETK